MEGLRQYQFPNPPEMRSGIPIDPEHPFPPDKEQFARQLLKDVGLPVRRIKELAYMPNTHASRGVMGSWEMGGPHNGRFSFYKDLEHIPSIAQLGVAVHEGAHVSSPFAEDTTKEYGSQTKRLRAQENVINIALQAEQTGIFLNGYHKFIYSLKDQIPDPNLWAQLYLEETHAIASELAATNYLRLANVEERQWAVLRSQGRQNEFTPLVTRRNAQTGKLRPSGIDQTLMDLTKTKNVKELHDHWQKLKNKYGNKITPFHRRERPQFLPIPPGMEIIFVPLQRRDMRAEDTFDPFVLSLPLRRQLR